MRNHQRELENLLRETGCRKVHEPLWTPEHPVFKGVVVVEYKDWLGRPALQLIRFGNWQYASGCNDAVSKDYLKRHGRKVHSGRTNGEYWEYYYTHAKGATPWTPGDPKPSGIMKRGK